MNEGSIKVSPELNIVRFSSGVDGKVNIETFRGKRKGAISEMERMLRTSALSEDWPVLQEFFNNPVIGYWITLADGSVLLHVPEECL